MDTEKPKLPGSADEPRWRPSPKFLLRRYALEKLTAPWLPGRFLELGAGTGTMTRLFLDRGFSGICFDVSEDSLAILSKNLEDYRDTVATSSELAYFDPETFDYIFAFEVLEHIDKDLNALESWTKKLKPGGRVLLSVPAHQRKYSEEDQFVGHVRRYEKEQLRQLMTAAGYEHVLIYSYGFPLGNVTGFLSRIFNLSGRGRNHMEMTERSIQSGVQRSRAIQNLGFLYNEKLLAPFCFIQTCFWRLDIGDGYIAMGLKPHQLDKAE